ncbi:MAG: bifunctional metallophosphatase/5'-nucleotidase [Saprospiraceae bacterium]|nr:bifunctional metallophosphatase/5'-nucleotidase [Saprospiraceae bacterium]
MANRRKFIQQTLLGGVGLGLTPLVASAENTVEAHSTPLSKNADFLEKEAVKKTITLLQTTDVHCQVHPHDELFWENNQIVFRKTAGYAQMATLFDSVRKQNPDTFILDTGDMFQGSLLSVKTMGTAYVDILNALGYDLYLPGNWEVIYGKNKMQKLLGALKAPKVCANMYHDLGGGKKGELIFPAYHIMSKHGVKIGFLGYTDHLVPIRQSPNYSKGIVYTKPEENLGYWVDVLKEQEQCDFVIIIAHLGLSQQLALANLPECKGVDYIFGGDTHERVRKPIQCKYAKVVEPGAFGSFVGRLDLTVENGKIVGEKYELMEVNAKKYKPKPSIQALVTEQEKPFVDTVNKVHGYSTVPLYRYFVVENTIDTLIIDALKWRVETDIVLSNGFRFCPPRDVDASGKAAITEGYIYDMLPVDSQVRTAVATGKQLKDWLEKELNNVFAKDASKRFGGWVVKMKGMEMTFNAKGEMGQRTQAITVGGKPLEMDKEYTICACERDGDPETMLCRIPNVKNGKNTPYTLHQTMRDYLAAHSPVTPRPHGHVKVLDMPQTLLSQVFDIDYQFV